MNSELQEKLKRLPQMGHLLESAELRSLAAEYSHELIKHCCEQVIAEARRTIREENIAAPDEATMIVRIRSCLDDFLRPRIKRVLNATGIILHTGLGRAPLNDEAYQIAFKRVAGACDLELDLQSGQRGDRQGKLEDLLGFITGAEAAAVVNNNAAAVLITLNTLANRAETLVSRGQLIEIGGAFRLPEIMRKSGTRLVEVGTTNRTYLKDYTEAITPRTKVILVAHSSNYRIKGFVHEEEIESLADLCLKKSIYLVHDLGGGVVVDLKSWSLPEEPVVQKSITAGAHVVTFSGDKILGGPQSGIIVGEKVAIQAIRKNPLMRALRPDKVTLALLEETLKLYLAPQRLIERHPVLERLREPQEQAQGRAEAILHALLEKGIPASLKIDIVKTQAQLGSGALPLEEFPSAALRIKCQGKPVSEIARILRTADPPVIGRLQREALFLDVKAIYDDDIFLITRSLSNLFLRIN
ncbi:MAG: L-seryl-tRNA(Sec) selenium transferase [bacterium]|nr:L-seryl-tRNA(Sec) selenium transferase [bacterium]